MDIQKSYSDFSKLRAIFIGGLRRSGTTLIQRLLDGHSQLLVYPLEDCIVRDFFFQKKTFDLSCLNSSLEQHYWEQVYQCLIANPKLSLVLDEEINAQDASTAKVHFHLCHRFSAQNNINEKEFHQNFLRVNQFQSKKVDIGDITRIWIFTFFYTLGIRNFTTLKAWVTKCPEEGKCFNFYRQYFPNYKIIHLVRDPRGFYASEKQKRINLEWTLGNEMIALDYTNKIRLRVIKIGYGFLHSLKFKSSAWINKAKKCFRKFDPRRIFKQLNRKQPEPGKKLSNYFIHITDRQVRNASINLRKYKKQYAGHRCFIMGNGPSLNKMDLSLFKNEYVWASNRSYLLFDRIEWRPKFYIAVDTRVVPDNAEEINQLSAILPDTSFFYPLHFRYDRVLRSNRNVYWYKERKNDASNLPFSMFSLNPAEFVYSVKTVTVAALQLAVYLGFNPTYLIGCDTNYSIPGNVIFEDDKNRLIVSTKDDPNHFHKDYFGAGKKWHAPNVDKMIFHYEQAKKVCDEIDVQIFDATVDGKLQVFPKIDYRRLFT